MASISSSHDEAASHDREAKRWRQFKFFILLPVSVGTVVSYAVLFILGAIHHFAPQTDGLLANAQKIALYASLGSALVVALIGNGLITKGLTMPRDSEHKR